MFLGGKCRLFLEIKIEKPGRHAWKRKRSREGNIATILRGKCIEQTFSIYLKPINIPEEAKNANA
jgi:hypothetical protein